ncbi:MAG TPA: PKD domain-containing protein [Edaphocola sp.]|nr:PKD domain-containing protein [Edaphocola sp.]
MKSRFTLLAVLLFVFGQSHAKKVKALFIGNSYTYVNNLPELVKQMAATGGDTLEYESSTPGGYTLQQHTTNSTTLNLIQNGNWDFVILQEQSQLPSFPDQDVANMVYPYAKALDSIIKLNNPCATTLFYMTWGRKNGDSQNCPNFPPLCTYQGMDSLLQLRYTNMADQNHAAISPVAVVWRALRNSNPNIDLYSSDESHPSLSGSFAAACSFYSVMFEKSPASNSFNSTLNTNTAQIIKTKATEIVYDSLSFWNRFLIQPKANFTSSINQAMVSFTNLSENATKFTWDFGDGNQDTIEQPSHTYTNSGAYTVTLIAQDTPCLKSDTFVQNISVTVNPSNINNTNIKSGLKLYPNPSNQYLNFNPIQNISKYEIVDVLGKTVAVHNFLVPETLNRINIQNLYSGLYLLKLEKSGQIWLGNFIKK